MPVSLKGIHGCMALSVCLLHMYIITVCHSFDSRQSNDVTFDLFLLDKVCEYNVLLTKLTSWNFCLDGHLSDHLAML